MIVGSLTSVARSVAEAVTSEDSYTNIVDAEAIGSGSFGMVAGGLALEETFQVVSVFSRPVLTVIEGGKGLGVVSSTLELSSLAPAFALGLMTIALLGSPDTFIGGEPGVITEDAALVASGSYYDPATGDDVVSQPIMEEGSASPVSNNADDNIFQMFLGETSLDGAYGFDYALWNLYRDCQALIASEYPGLSADVSEARHKLDELIKLGKPSMIGSQTVKLPYAMHGLDQLLANQFGNVFTLLREDLGFGPEMFPYDPDKFSMPIACASHYLSRMVPAGYMNSAIKNKLLKMKDNLMAFRKFALDRGYKQSDLMIKHIDDLLRITANL